MSDELFERQVGTAKLAAALAKAQGAFPKIPRDRTVKVKTRSGSEYTFDYAPLETIMEAIRKPLADNELAIIQSVRDDRVVTTLLHSSGEYYVSGGTPIFPGDSGAQAYGSALTYARRYDLTLTLNITADEDDDANASAGNQREYKERAHGKGETGAGQPRTQRENPPQQAKRSEGPPPAGPGAFPEKPGPGQTPAPTQPVQGSQQSGPRKRPTPSGDMEIDRLKFDELSGAITAAKDEGTLKVAFLDAYQFAGDIDDDRVAKPWQMEATKLKDERKKALGI